MSISINYLSNIKYNEISMYIMQIDDKHNGLKMFTDLCTTYIFTRINTDNLINYLSYPDENRVCCEYVIDK